MGILSDVVNNNGAQVPVLVKDMQIPSPPQKEGFPFLAQIVMQCSEYNEEKNLRFVFFELLMILFIIFKRL